MDSSEASQSRGHIPLMRLMYCFSVISSTKPNVAGQWRAANGSQMQTDVQSARPLN
jgi:hypothetical protein